MGRTKMFRIHRSSVQARLDNIIFVYFIPGNIPKTLILSGKKFGASVGIFFRDTLLKSTEPTASGLESQHKVSFLTFSAEIQLFRTYKSTLSHQCFEPYGRCRLGQFPACFTFMYDFKLEQFFLTKVKEIWRRVQIK